MSDSSARDAAIHRLNRKRGFISYIVGAVVISLLMVVIWALTDRGPFWPGFVMLGFLVGLVVYGINMVINKPPTDEQINREMQKGS